MSALISAILDLVKYQIIKMVDTGDKTFDSLVVVLLTLLISMFTSWITTNIFIHLLKAYVLLSLFRKRLQDGPIPQNQLYL